jgi:uncharacterized repeat protein (TIGR02543 family)
MATDIFALTIQDKTTGVMYDRDGTAPQIPVGDICTALFSIQNVSTASLRVRLLIEVYNPYGNVVAYSWKPSATTYLTLAPNVQVSSNLSGDFALNGAGLYMINTKVEIEGLPAETKVWDGVLAVSIVKHTLQISSTTGGKVTTPGVGTFTYDENAIIPLIVTPSSGYQFVGWTGDVDTISAPNAASTSIWMQGDYFITANFQKISATYSLTMAVNGSGTTSPSVGQHTYAAGAVVRIVATPSSGYRFVNWTGNVSTVANVNSASTTITMQGNYGITANFEAISQGAWANLAEFTVYLQPYPVPGWGSPLAEFTVYLQPMPVAGWGSPLAEFTVTLTPMPVAGWGNPLAEFTVTLTPMLVAGWGYSLAEFTITLQPPVIACSTDTDCPEGWLCKDGVCVPKGGVPWGWIALGGAGVAAVAIITSKKKKKEPKKEPKRK